MAQRSLKTCQDHISYCSEATIPTQLFDFVFQYPPTVALGLPASRHYLRNTNIWKEGMREVDRSGLLRSSWTERQDLVALLRVSQPTVLHIPTLVCSYRCKATL